MPKTDWSAMMTPEYAAPSAEWENLLSDLAASPPAVGAAIAKMAARLARMEADLAHLKERSTR